MQVVILSVGKKHDRMYEEAILEFTSRLQHYTSLEWRFLSPAADSDPEKEGRVILESIQGDDILVALDERGKLFDTEKFAGFIEARQVASVKRLVFLIGGAYGISKEVLGRARLVWSLSPLTFPHQLVRLILAEQIYRAFTFLKGEKYHHGN